MSGNGAIIHLTPKETFDRSFSPLIDESGIPLIQPNRDVWRVSLPYMAYKWPNEPYYSAPPPPAAAFLIKPIPPIPGGTNSSYFERSTASSVAQGRHYFHRPRHSTSVDCSSRTSLMLPSLSVMSQPYHGSSRPQSCCLPLSDMSSSSRATSFIQSVHSPNSTNSLKPTPANDSEYQVKPTKEQKEKEHRIEDIVLVKGQPPKTKHARQIVVKSIDDEHQVWISIDPNETGKSLSKKIFTLASFRSYKVLGIKTASGRQIMLDKTLIFEGWEDMDQFEDGELWDVTWGSRKRSFLDIVFSKFSKELFDLFGALLIQVPLSDHRSLLRTYPHTFTTDEAVECLGHLEFTQLVSTPNPLDPSKPLITRTTTTFSMSRAIAKTLGQHFINARLVENATDPQNRTMKDRGIWIPTPKGKHVIRDFSHRACISIKHMQSHLSHIQTFQVVQFERLLEDDQIAFSRQDMMDAFRTMMLWLPTDNLMIDDVGGVNNANLIEYKDTFYGFQCFEWISEYTSVVSEEEAIAIAAEFVQYGWMLQVLDKSDRDLGKKDTVVLFKAGRKTQYYLTSKGRQMIESSSRLQSFLSSGSGPGMHVSRSRTQSSATTGTTSSSSSIKTNNSNGSGCKTSFRSRKEEYASRLLPTTAVTPSANYAGITPKALMTQHSTTSVGHQVIEENKSTKPSVNTFGFSPESNEPHNYHPLAAEVPLSTCSEEVEDQISHLSVGNTSEASYPSTTDHTQSQTVSQIARLHAILEDPLARMYFRNFLKKNFCEENINFWVDYNALIKKSGCVVEEGQSMTPHYLQLSSSLVNTLLVYGFAIYHSYFCPENAPNELNIDHGLRYDIIQYMQSTFSHVSSADDSDEDVAGRKTKKPTVADSSNVPFGSISVSSQGLVSPAINMASYHGKKKDGKRLINGSNGPLQMSIRQGVQDSPQVCLYRLMQLYEQVNDHVCRTMAQDSVPRFLKTPEYQELMKSYYQSAQNRKKKEEESEEESDESDESDDTLSL
ncbi:Developmental regulator flbA [Choanephora cucurbitarum]|uniref:Developmental regulator flbA n=1 Tax=Choanephora cucurbitarum TaxID=101091 RepID=A0A1C7NKD7_9FUNG|nr:Developmental regulator flbA [Choanephora cucurbitarum]